MSGRTNQQWARALADCGVLRVKFDDEVIIAAIEDGSAVAEPVDGEEDWLDIRPSDQTAARWRSINRHIQRTMAEVMADEAKAREWYADNRKSWRRA